MSYINDIQQAIISLDGGGYEKLIDEYLYKKYGFSNIQPLGVQTATNKPTKGIPDSYVRTETGKYILICCGHVRDQAVEKIKKDIDACFDKGKLNLDSRKIEKIICCFTSTNIHIEEYEELKNYIPGINIELISLGTLSHDLRHKYPHIAANHLGIEIDTNQIFDIDDFVHAYDSTRINAPINTYFYHRTDELKSIEQSIKDWFITIITGASGVGKTRLTLEACRRYESNDWKVLCIRSIGRELYSDIDHYLCDNERYLLFFDDANDVVSLDNVLRYVLSKKDRENLRIVLTIRDYAKNYLGKKLTDYSSITNTITVNVMKDEEIRDILEKEFSINNRYYLERIIEVACGNIRLAIMAGIRSLESGLSSIYNAESIFSLYYEPILDKSGLERNELVLLSIIAFCGTIRPNENELYQRLVNSYLKDVSIDRILDYLYQNELIVYFKEKIVKISDQSFGNYILYYGCYLKKWISLEDIFDWGFPKFQSRIAFVMSTLYSIFMSEDVKLYIDEIVTNAWERANPDLNIYYLESFCSLKPLKSLQILKEYVDVQKQTVFSLHDFTLEKEENYRRYKIKEVEILSHIGKTDYYSTAVDLLLTLYEKRPDYIVDVFFAIDDLIYNEYSLAKHFENERLIIEKIWERSKHGKEYNFIILLIHLAKHILQIEAVYTTNNQNRTMTFVTMSFKPIAELKLLRSTVLSILCELYDDDRYHDMTFDVLRRINHHSNDREAANEFFVSDYDSLYSFFSHKETISLEDAIVLSNDKSLPYLREMIDASKLNLLLSNHEYRIYDLIVHEQINDGYYEAYEENNKKSRGLLISEVSNYTLKDYEHFFLIAHYIDEHCDNYKWRLGEAIGVVFQSLENDEKYIEIAKVYMRSYAPAYLNQNAIIYNLLQVYGYKKTIEVINEAPESQRVYFKYVMFNIMPERMVDKSMAKDFYCFQKEQMAINSPLIAPLKDMRKYMRYDDSVLFEITEHLKKHPDYIDRFLGIISTPEDAKQILHDYDDNYEILTDLYFSCNSSFFDLRIILFKHLFSHDPEAVWEKFINMTVNKHSHENADNNRRVFEWIWHNHYTFERLDYAFNEILCDSFQIESTAKTFFSKSSNYDDEFMKKEWIKRKMLQNIENLEIVNTVLLATMAVYPEWKNEMILFFIHSNNRIECFKSLYLFPLTSSWAGSEIPLIDSRIKSLMELNEAITGVEYIDHKVYIEERIRSEKRNREQVEITEYLLDEDSCRNCTAVPANGYRNS